MRDKLDALLKKEFGNDYSVKEFSLVLSNISPKANAWLQVGDERIEIKAQRTLTQVRQLNCHSQHFSKLSKIFPGGDRFRTQHEMKEQIREGSKKEHRLASP